jgi:hypothetical protein
LVSGLSEGGETAIFHDCFYVGGRGPGVRSGDHRTHDAATGVKQKWALPPIRGRPTEL